MISLARVPSAVWTSDCSVKPLVIPIRNITFENGVSSNRGILVVLGDQVQGLRMSTYLNNTSLRNYKDCDEPEEICQGALGSLYDTSSDTFKQVYHQAEWDVVTIDRSLAAQPGSVEGYEHASFTDVNATIDKFPLEIWTAPEVPLNKSGLGFGPSSSVLQRMIKNKLAPSRAFSVDYGSRSVAAPRDGQVVIGGINTGRFNVDEDERKEYRIGTADAPARCPLQVLVESITVTNLEGNHSLMADPDSRIPFCIYTSQTAINLPPLVFQRWHQVTHHITKDGLGGPDFDDQTYPAEFEGNMDTLTFQLAGGYKTTIPHHELVTPDRGTLPTGEYGILNSSRIRAAVKTGPSGLGSNVPVLGGVFLAQNYLHVDYDRDTFWISPVVARGGRPDNIVTSCGPVDELQQRLEGEDPDKGLNLGLQIGLPAAFAAVAIGLLVYFLRFRQKRQQQQQKKPEILPWRDVRNTEAGY